MANVFFKKGLRGNLPTSYAAGTFYVTTDERAMYLDIDDSTRIRLGDFQEFATLDALKANVNPSTTAMYYVAELNVLAKWNGTEYIQINPDTGVTSVEVVGEGNAVTAASYDATTRKLTLTKGETFATKGELDALDSYVGDIPEGYTETNVVAYVNKKAQEVLTQATGGSSESAASVKAALDAYVEENDPKVTANTNAITAIKDGATIDSFADVETGLAGKVDKVEGKSLVSDTEITKLAGVSAGANKVESSTTNGNIKIDGVETVVYTHPTNHAMTEITGLADALNGKQAKGDYATKAEAQGYADAKDEAIAAAKTAGDNAQAHSEGVADDLAAHIAEAEGKYETKTDASAKLTEAKGYTDTEVAKVQGEVDALEELVGTLPEGASATTVVGYIDAKTANIASDETVGAIDDRVKAIEEDYLVEADKTELADAIAAEKERAEGVEAGLQTQINTIMNNPDAEGAINSINEFTAYVTEHGTIADGFRADIDQNKEDIAANTKAIEDHEALAAETYETKTDAGNKLTEAKGYTDTAKAAVIGTTGDASSADTVYGAKKYAEEKASAAQSAAETTAAGALAGARTEITAEIDADVKALADGAVATNATNIAANAEAIAKKANSADVYAKTETYTKDEVDAAVEAAVTAATTWGSF